MSTLIDAIKSNNTQKVVDLLNAGTSPNSAAWFFTTADTIPLYVAAEHHRHDIANLLIDYGANVNALSTTGYSALYPAVTQKDPQMVKILFEGGLSTATANIDIEKNTNALTYAVDHHNIKLIKVLLDHGVEVKTELGKALHLCASDAHTSTVALLLEHGANIDFKPLHEDPLLIAATKAGNFTMVEFLLDQGATLSSNLYDEISAANQCNHADQMLQFYIELAADRGINLRGALGNILATCAHDQDTIRTEFLLQNGADINFGMHHGETALVAATRAGNTIMIDFLLVNGATFSQDFKYELAASAECASAGAMIDFYLNQGAQKAGLTRALHIEISRNHLGGVKNIISALDNHFDRVLTHYSPLVTCAEDGASTQIAKFLLSCGYNVNYQGLEDHNTPLHAAVNHSNTSLVKLFLERGAHDSIDTHGKSAFYKAVEKCDYDIAAKLLECGSNANFTPAHSQQPTPLQITTAKPGTYEMKWHKLLIEYGANVNTADHKGDTPLHQAVKNSNLELTKLLLGHGAHDSIDSHGETALIKAVQNKQYDLAKTLLEYGSHPDFASSHGEQQAPLHIIASQYENYGVKWLKLFVQHGANINQVDCHGNAPLHKLFDAHHCKDDFQISKSYLKPDDALTASKILLEKGANTLHINDKLISVQQTAQSYFGEHEEMATFLELSDIYTPVTQQPHAIPHIHDVLIADHSPIVAHHHHFHDGQHVVYQHLEPMHHIEIH